MRARGRRLLAGRGSSASPGYPSSRLRAGRSAAARRTARRRRWSSPAAGPSSTARASTPSPRSSTWRWRSGCPAGRQRVRLPDRAGQRPGRPRARPEGRPAARLPADRGPGARARTSPRCGASTRPTLPGPGPSARTSCSTRSGTAAGPRALLVIGVQRRSVSAPNARRGRGRGCERWTCWWSSDVVPSETAPSSPSRAAGHPVGRGGRHDDQPGGPGDPPPPGARPAARRPQRPGRAAPSWPRRLGVGGRLRRRRRARCSTSCAGPPPAGPADYAGISYERIDAEGRRVLAVPVAPDHPGTPRLFAERLRPPRTGGPGSSRSSTGRPAEDRRTPTSRSYLTTGRVLAALPERRPDPPGAGAATGRAGRRSSSCTRDLAGRTASPTATWSRCRTRRAAGGRPGPGDRRDPAGHGVRAVPLGRRRRPPTR